MQLVNVIIEHLLCRDTLNYQKYTLISSQVTSYELARLFTLCRWQVSQNPVQISMHVMKAAFLLIYIVNLQKFRCI